MKNIIFIPFFLLHVLSGFAQYEKQRIEDSVQSIGFNIQKTDTLLVTNKTLNDFFARKLAYYLSGSNDLSLFNNYAVLDFGEDKAKIGWNINLSKPHSRVSDLLTVGLQSAVSKNFSALFSEKKFNNDIGLDLKYTYLFRGSLWFDKKIQKQQAPHALGTGGKSQKDLMDQKRILAKYWLQGDIERGYKEYRDYIDSLKKSKPVDAETITAEEKSKFEELQKKIIKLFYDNELEQLENYENKAYNSCSVRWVSFTGFIPVTKATYSGTTDLTIEPFDLVSRKWNAGVSYSLMKDYKRNKLFFNLGFNIFKNNSVEAELMEKLSLEKFKVLSVLDDTTLSANLKRDDVYLGKYQTFWTPNVKVQMVFYPYWSPKVGIDLSVLKKFGKDQALDFLVGIPIALTGQEDDKPVNIILQVKIPDINNKNQPDTRWKDKLQVGFTVGLPFNSILK